MVTRKSVFGALAASFLAFTTPMAYAGSGGFPPPPAGAPLGNFYICQGISGDAPGTTVDLGPSDLGPERRGVRIGNAALACTPVSVYQPDTFNEIVPLVVDEHLKCYTVSVSRKQSGTPRITLIDDLGGTESGLQATEVRYLCGPATKQ